MDRVIIYNENKSNFVEMPRVRDIQVGAQPISKSVTMASGKIVKDIIGYRTTISASWDWLPAETLMNLATLLKEGIFFYVEYPSPTGGGEGVFEVTYPTMSIFAFKNNVPVWHDVKLTMTAQGVS